MAKVKFANEVLAELLFGWTARPVEVGGAVGDPFFTTFEISGPDVPATDDAVRCVITLEQNRAGEQLRRMTFEKY